MSRRNVLKALAATVAGLFGVRKLATASTNDSKYFEVQVNGRVLGRFTDLRPDNHGRYLAAVNTDGGKAKVVGVFAYR